MTATNFSMALKRSNTDEWYTYPEGVQIIVPYLKAKGYKKIICPFDKVESNYVKVLSDCGFDVKYGHIETGQDFFEIKDFDKYDAVVSNPPFSKREAILARLYEVGIPFAMVLNFNGLFDSRRRWELFRENGIELLIPKGRMHFFNEGCRGNAPNFQSVYVCRYMLNRQIEFAELPKRTEEGEQHE